MSRRVRKVVEATSGGKESTLDLSNHQDVADFLLKKNANGYESASSAASSAGEEDSDNAVSLPRDYVGRNNKKGDRRAVRLDEIGPRMELSLIKIVEGVPGKEGSVIFHRFGMFFFLVLVLYSREQTFPAVKKTRREAEQQTAEHDARQKLRKERKEEQERNVQRKKVTSKKGQPETDENDIDDDNEHSQEELDDKDDEGEWDGDEEISDIESEEEEEAGKSSETESEAEPPARPAPKKRKP